MMLALVVFLPAIAALALAVPRKLGQEQARVVALAASLAVLVIAGVLFVAFDGETPGINLSWVESLNVNLALGADGISITMIALTAMIVPLSILISWKMDRGFLVALLFLETGMMGTFAARDLLLFYVFWEATLIPMYFIIGMWGGPRRVYAAVKFILYTVAGSVLMLVAIIYCGVKAGGFDFARVAEAMHALPASEQEWLFLAFALAFAVKVPMFPFHTWLPDAHVEAPTAGSVILAGVLLKMGAYGFIRFAIPFFPEAAAAYAPHFAAGAVFGILYGAAMAMAQTDMKKLVAYSSVSHMGFVMLGIFSGTVEGTQGAVMQMVNHGLSTGALFLLVGMIYSRTHRRGIDDYGGMARVTPVFAVCFMIVTLSSIGLPGLNGFVGEFLILLGSFSAHPVATALGALGVVFGAVYMLKMYRDIFWGPVTLPEREGTPDLGRLDRAILAPLIVLIIALGVRPGIVLDQTKEASAKAVVNLSDADTIE